MCFTDMDNHDVFDASSSDEGEQFPQSQSVDQEDQLKGKQTRGRTWMSKITKKGANDNSSPFSTTNLARLWGHEDLSLNRHLEQLFGWMCPSPLKTGTMFPWRSRTSYGTRWRYVVHYLLLIVFNLILFITYVCISFFTIVTLIIK